MQSNDYNKWDLQPRILTDGEIANPMMVVNEVFDYAYLPDLRNTLWEWLKTTVTGNYNKKSLHYKDRESLMAFYEKMQKLLEASHLLLIAKNLTAPAKQNTTALSVNAKSDPNQPHEPARNLIHIIDKLITLFSPEYLFEMGSLQEPNHPVPMYFFLLVLPNTATRTYAECLKLAENACTDMGLIQLIAVKQNELRKYLQEGHLLYSTVCKKDKLVYATDSQLLSVVNTCKLPEKVAEAKSILDALLAQAQSVYEGAIFYFHQPNYPLAVFMLQQALEYCLRGFIGAVTGRNTVSHDLVLLRRHALPFFPNLVHLLPVEQDKEICLLHRTSKAYVRARYERDFTMPVRDISRLKSWAEALLPATSEAFEQWVAAIPK